MDVVFAGLMLALVALTALAVAGLQRLSRRGSQA
jgi:hypothetical protein